MMLLILLILQPTDAAGNSLEDEVRSWILSQEIGYEGTLHVDRVVYPRVTRIPSGKVSYVVRPRPMRSLVGRLSLYVDIHVNNNKVKIVVAQAETSLETMVARVVNNTERGEPIGDHHISWEMQRVYRINNPLIEPIDFEQGLRAKTVLRAGVVLDRRNCEVIPLVERNHIVQVTAQDRGLVIRLKALALQSGAEGDLIRIKNQDTGRTMRGTVQADGSVQLMM